jgi:hypothetical protein
MAMLVTGREGLQSVPGSKEKEQKPGKKLE